MRKLFILVCLLAGAVALAGSAERLALYPFDPRAAAPDLPGFAAHRLPTDAAELVTWLRQPDPGKPVVFYLHGNSGNLADRRGRFKRFADRGYGIFALAYPGSSGSSGTPSEATITESAYAAYRALSDGSLNIKSSAKSVVFYGESLGAAVAISLLRRLQSERIPPPEAVILEAPFASLEALAAHHYGSLSWLVNELESRWPSLTYAKAALDRPLLVIHGTNDDLIPHQQGRAIYTAAPSREKLFISVSGGTHTTLWRSDVLPQIWRFIDRYGR